LRPPREYRIAYHTGTRVPDQGGISIVKKELKPAKLRFFFFERKGEKGGKEKKKEEKTTVAIMWIPKGKEE